MDRSCPKIQKERQYFGLFVIALYFTFITVFISGCAKEDEKVKQSGDIPPISAAIAQTFPANLADTVVVNPVIAVTFKSTENPSVVSATTLSLKEGTISVQGTVSYSGTTVNFVPSADLKADTKYTATVRSSSHNDSGDEEHSWTFTTGRRHENSFSVASVTPSNGSMDVLLNIHPEVTFNQNISSSMKNSISISLKQGTIAVSGSLSYSDKTITFIPSQSLNGGTQYTGKVSFGKSNNKGEDDDHNSSSSIFTWSFTTGGGSGTDTTAPMVNSVVPANNATAVALNSKLTVTFSEAMDPATINVSTFTLKQGANSVPGSISYTGTTATFTPSSVLSANMVYTGNITTGAKDLAGNPISSNYSWSFTSAGTTDATAPTVVTVNPANNGTNVAVNSKVTVNFSEAMNSSTINSSTFTLKQGSTSIVGSVTYSGTMAIFTPGSNLAANTIYTGTITTGAKDAAGNAIASNYTWSFTTVAAVPVISFASDVLPILQAKCMPCHGANSPSAGISITNYTTVSKLTNSQIDNSGMYTKMGVTTAEKDIIRAWLAAGRLNN